MEKIAVHSHRPEQQQKRVRSRGLRSTTRSTLKTRSHEYRSSPKTGTCDANLSDDSSCFHLCILIIGPDDGYLF
jgi:hypothetical protein